MLQDRIILTNQKFLFHMGMHITSDAQIIHKVVIIIFQLIFI